MIITLGKYIIIIDDNVINFIFNTRQSNVENEVGGIILGNITSDNRIIVRMLRKATDPTKSSKYYCVRDKVIAQKIIDKEFKESKGRIIYLGEWHTHPESIPKPSSQDRIMIKEQFIYNYISTDFLLLIIIGQKKDYIGCYYKKKLLSNTFNSTTSK